ncbi:UDP-glucose 4-epimerase [Candidatus Gottesmanbacteria bacterium RIFCSPLOWO2_02_FULL_40_10]|uniref:UDP-glucose 4-epimerase n=1 Tax=Candidatus Gottesmanbacteria bacterium RIFCSPHIGHO2_01_FULL_40_15 TaxID=1798376 RepID=A0A1F5Z1U6_9BACT|nr:MAG: UDP-glucose 4-epimerase [Candidatus Gottesmanbacteria bacterium RIFCSPHIGHO2_01_FULL_40_15]OGG33262.1 MAG: UDP-glucose 4-epimerase [Candidatus Gottesmanbacteria bacterium RIFCSPLOWO2_02_FULL_40_10]
MNILVTGGAGFIGSHIVDEFICLGHQVAVIDDLSTGKKEFINKKAHFFKVDIRDKREIASIIKKIRPDIISHHAAQISVRNSVENPGEDAQVNILGLLNLLEAGRLYGLKKVLFASSGGVVYGEADRIPTPESYDPKLPLSPYGITKLAGEFYLSVYMRNYKIDYVALRYSNVYGPRQNPHGEAGVVAIFSNSLLTGLPPVINGDGRQTRDYIFVKDVVNANVRAISAKYSGPVNIGTGIETDVLAVFSGIKNHVRTDISPRFGPAKKGEQRRSCLNVNLAKKAINWQPAVTLSRGLENTVLYFRADR